MLKYLAKRMLTLIPVVILISVLLFLISRWMPGDPVGVYFGVGSHATAEQQERARKLMGLDKPLFFQYFKWLWDCLRGDFGQSTLLKKPVSQVIGPLMRNSLRLNVTAFLLALGIAVPVGIRSAWRQSGLYDKSWSLLALLGISLPSFFLGLLLIHVFAADLGWLPVSGMVTAGKTFASWAEREADILRHMVLPVAVLTAGSAAELIRYVRGSMLEVIGQDYIRTARAKGLAERAVLYRHAFRNALLPLITLLGLRIPSLLAGAVILETVFVWPGIGKTLYDAFVGRDYGLIMACNMIFVGLLLAGNILADIGCALADPRIRMGKGGAP